jgi:hypothetical protein
LYGGTFTTVQQAKLNTGEVGDAGHDAVHCIDFTDQVALSQPANCRVAGHHTDIGMNVLIHH